VERNILLRVGMVHKERGVGIYEQKKRGPPRKAATTRARGRGEPRHYNGLRGHLKVAATGIDSVGCGGAGGYWGSFADGVAVDYEFDAAIALAAFGGVVGGYGLGFAEAAGRH